MTAEEFERRAFWTLSELLGALHRAEGEPSRRQLREWLHAAGIVRHNAARVPIVMRCDLEVKFPELLEELRRRSAPS